MFYVTDDKEKIETAIEAAHLLLRVAGYEYKRTLASATFTRRYVNKAQRSVISIDGWHGSGKGNRNYGDGMTVHSVYGGYNAVEHPTGMFVPHSENKCLLNVGAGLLGEYALSELYDYHRNRCVWQSSEKRDAALADIASIPQIITDFLLQK